MLGVLFFVYQIPAIASPICASAAPHHEESGPATMERQGPDASVETSVPGHTLPVMACDVGTHCASNFPSPRMMPLLEAPLAIDDPGASMMWGLHTAPPSQPTPPPKT